jgi:hypothetical protein
MYLNVTFSSIIMNSQSYCSGEDFTSQRYHTQPEGARKTSQQIAEKASQVKGTVLEGAQKVVEKGAHAKDTVVEGPKKSTQYATEKGIQAKDTVAEGT